MRLPILLAVLILGYLAYRSIKRLPPAQKRSTLIKYAVYLTIAILLIATFTGKIHWLGGVFAAALGFLKFGASTAIRFFPYVQTLRKAKIVNDPVFKTALLKVTFHIDSGRISGSILQGEFAGKSLNELSEQDFSVLEASTRDNDKRSFYLLKLIQQRLNPNQSNSQEFSPENLAEPNIEEARLMLGLNENFTKKDLDLAYKRLMQKMHPDRGGNDYLASRLNVARDILLRDLNK